VDLQRPGFRDDAGLGVELRVGFGMTTFGGGIRNLTPTLVATRMNVKILK